MTSPSAASTPPAAGPLRFGLLGTGPWAQRVHGPALVAHPGTELVGVWGRRPEAAAELADELSTRAYDDVDALIADVDAIAVALPPDIQAPLAVRAARAGRHLLLDKPVATTVEGARELADAARDVASVVFFTLRFSAAAAPWIDEQAGRDGWYTGRADWIGSIYAPDAKSTYADSPWRRDRGALWDVGPHALSVLLPVFGEVSEVTGLRGQLDTVHLVLRHASGTTSTSTLSLTAPEKAGVVSAELRGAHGVAELPDIWGDGPLASYGTAIDALVESVRTGEPHPCDVRFGAQVTEILARAEASLR
ncbi:Gfo/Idh/MocA family oxidoreductase [Streptomyces sp. TRM66268-LWL]|uniref:Gfo/Idh/MocA family oxidoreductase n=1 Tax=Streptomyces polyasparticus TaxID=2767826 RepID=A0ABR7SA69_9ACTN|nr:Gfo/Idh/MocA family oxidoreductase [Streptomyces polyasparticus]MBC9712371.1 Gfo/Idh/MocA family oxidoreductase [Streptomyces polyasparticus]